LGSSKRYKLPLTFLFSDLLGRPRADATFAGNGKDFDYQQADNNPHVILRRRRPTTASAGPNKSLQESGKSKINRLATTINSQLEAQSQLINGYEDSNYTEIPEIPLYQEVEEPEKLAFSTFPPGAIKLNGCRSHLDKCNIEQITLRRLRFVIESNEAVTQHLSLLDLIENGYVRI
jgi:hypothetical protein